MPLDFLYLYLIIGAVAGTISGIFGVGGGLVIVPALVYCFELIGMDQQFQLHVAIATSLALIIANALSASSGHYRRGNIRFDAFKLFAPGTICGAAFGVALVHQISGWMLQLFFVIFLFTMSLNMLFGRTVVTDRHLPGAVLATGLGAVIGASSAMLGIGGGSFFVPLLCYRGIDPRKAVGTAALLGLPLALVAVAVNLLSQPTEADFPSQTIGYIYIPVFLAMLVTGPICAYAGSFVASKLPPVLLKRLFALLLLVIAIDFCFRRVL